MALIPVDDGTNDHNHQTTEKVIARASIDFYTGQTTLKNTDKTAVFKIFDRLVFVAHSHYPCDGFDGGFLS